MMLLLLVIEERTGAEGVVGGSWPARAVAAKRIVGIMGSPHQQI